MCLTVRSKLEFTGKGNRRRELRKRWEGLLRKGALDVVGVGIHELRGRRFVLER